MKEIFHSLIGKYTFVYEAFIVKDHDNGLKFLRKYH